MANVNKLTINTIFNCHLLFYGFVTMLIIEWDLDK